MNPVLSTRIIHAFLLTASTAPTRSCVSPEVTSPPHESSTMSSAIAGACEHHADTDGVAAAMKAEGPGSPPWGVMAFTDVRQVAQFTRRPPGGGGVGGWRARGATLAVTARTVFADPRTAWHEQVVTNVGEEPITLDLAASGRSRPDREINDKLGQRFGEPYEKRRAFVDAA